MESNKEQLMVDLLTLIISKPAHKFEYIVLLHVKYNNVQEHQNCTLHKSDKILIPLKLESKI